MVRWSKRHLLPVLAAVAMLALLPSYVWAYRLTGGSAAPNMLVGDTIIVNRAAYDLRAPYTRATLIRIGSPRRFDLVQAELPEGVGWAFKRVIGLPGETVEFRENRVFIDGRPLAIEPAQLTFTVPPRHRLGNTIMREEGHLIAYTPGAGQDRNCAPVRLGSTEYFLVGDNRDDSLDSRSFGPVSRDKMLGRVLTVIRKGR